MRLEAGRDLTARDGVDAPPVVIVNRAFTRRFFPGEPDARILDRPQLEMPVRSFNREGVSIAGIVADARTVGLADEPAPHVFKPYAQFFAGVPGFLVRTSADPLALAPAIRAELATPPAGAGTTEIGERTLGPIRLQGRQVQEGLGRTEYWVHYPPVMETAADPLAYPPIVVEMTIFMDSGERFEIRAISAQRIPPAPDIFAVPGPVP